MSVCIIGSGFSGFAMAIKLKVQRPDIKVLVVSNQKSGNTVMAGQRFRPRASPCDDEERDKSNALVQMLQRRNNMTRTPAMGRYAVAALEEERPEWFVPQWGRPNPSGNDTERLTPEKIGNRGRWRLPKRIRADL